MDYKQRYAIEQKNKQRLIKHFPMLADTAEQSGIYVFLREESGFKYAYVGQAKHLLTRLASHLVGYQHIDLSLKKHGLYSADNSTGWTIKAIRCDIDNLDKVEQFYISEYANAGYQMRNKTSGSQGEGKFGIADNKPSKGYYDGVKQGYKNAVKEISKLYRQKDEKKKDGTASAIAIKASEKLAELLKED